MMILDSGLLFWFLATGLFSGPYNGAPPCAVPRSTHISYCSQSRCSKILLANYV